MAPQLCVFFFQWCAAFLLWLLLQRYGIQLFVCVCVCVRDRDCAHGTHGTQFFKVQWLCA